MATLVPPDAGAVATDADLFESLLPRSVATAETFEDLLDADLFPEELEAVGRAVEKRRREFVTGRACARRALERLGIEPCSIGSGERGEPLWPAGVRGSITHCLGYRACAAARTGDVTSLGIDAEVNEPLPDGVLATVSCASERAVLPESDGGVHMDRLLFSAKESVYKAWFPLARRWLGFEDVHLTVDPAAATFSARLLVPGPMVDGRPLTHLDGRWRVGGGVLATTVVVAGGSARGEGA